MIESFYKFVQVVCVCQVIKIFISIIIPENKVNQIITSSVNIIITFEVMKSVVEIVKNIFNIF